MDMKDFRIKLLISLFLLSILAVHTLSKEFELDAISLGLLGLAALPWFSDFIQSAELPGGWKVVFKDIDEIKQQQEIQGKEIQRLSFLMNNFLNQNQLNCLRAMQAGDHFKFDKRSGVTEQDKDDIRRLFSAGLIDRRPGKGFRTLFDQGEDEQNVNDHFCITDQGIRFLDLLNPDENLLGS